jgi:hypothetical protein
MIRPMRPQIVRSKNSNPSSRSDRIVLRCSKPIAVSERPHILLFGDPEKPLNRSPPGSFLYSYLPRPPTKTHKTRTLQRFRPIHF